MRSTFIGFVRKEFYHILRDRRTLLVLFGMPVIMMVLFGFAIRNEIQDVRLAVVDPSRDAVTTDIVDKLTASGYFELVGYASGREELESAFRQGRITEAVVFEPDFAHRMAGPAPARVQVITDATNPNTASTVLAYTTAIIQDYLRELADDAPPPSWEGVRSDEEPIEGAEGVPGSRENSSAGIVPISGGTSDPAGLVGTAAGAAPSPAAGSGPRIVPEFRMRYNPELKSVYLFVPGLIALILMLVSALMTSITITREREMGTMEVLLVSPLHPVQIIVGKVVPYLALSFMNVLTILVLSTFVFDVPIRGSLALLLGEAFLFTLCALSLGILISARSKSLQTATMIALAGLLMPTVLLSGFIFPIASMPEPLQALSHIIPAKWFLIIVRGIMIRGVGIEFVWKETLVLAAMTLLFMGVSVRSFNIRLE